MRIDWDKYEVALLIETYMATKDLAAIEKKEYYAVLSSRLRQKAINSGNVIDARYRNLNGIAMRMANIQFLFTGKGLRAYSSLDAIMHDMYLHDPTEFSAVLKEAKKMTDGAKTGQSNRMPESEQSGVNNAHSVSAPTFKSDKADQIVRFNDNRADNTSLTRMDFQTIDFSKPLMLAYTKPIFMSLFGNDYEANSWQSIYYEFCNVLITRDSMLCSSLMGKNLLGAGRVDFSYSSDDITSSRPKRLNNGLYYESNYSATDLMRRLKVLLDMSHIPYDACRIGYVFERPVNQNRIVVPASKREQTSQYSGFAEWLISEGFAANTAQNYASAIKTSSDFAMQNGIAAVPFLEFTDKDELRKCLVALFENERFAEINASQHNRQHAALQKLFQFRFKNTTSFLPATPYAGRLTTTRNREVHQNQIGFLNWLLTQGFATNTAPNYVSAINSASQFAVRNGIAVKQIYDITEKPELDACFSTLFAHPEFVSFNSAQHNRYSAAMNKYYAYFCGETFSQLRRTTRQERETRFDDSFCANCTNLINTRFANGIRFDYSLELRKFRQLYNDTFEAPIDLSDDDLRTIIRSAGLEYNGRVYTPETMLDSDSKAVLFDYIANAFSSGRKVLYYETIYKEFEESFYSSKIYSADVLKSYLDYCNDGTYNIQRSFITSVNAVSADPVDEIRDCLRESNGAMSFFELEAALPFIPLSKIKQVLALYPEFVWVRTETYIHVDCVELYSSDIDAIRRIISAALESDGFLSAGELIRKIQAQHPEIIEKNSIIADSLYIGFRDVIKYHLGDEFCFSGNIISSLNASLSTWDVYASFCKHHEEFSLASLDALSDEIGTPIYFDAVYDNCIRINQEKFVSRSRVRFDIAATDAAIGRFVQSDYIPISAIQSFALFPSIEFPWNGFLLEHYVYAFSHDYTILHAASFNAKGRCGAIVRKNAKYSDFSELLADALAKADIPLDIPRALNYLAMEGFLGKRKYGEIEKVVESAKQLRNRKG